MLVKRKSDDVASLRIAAVELGGLARTSPHDDENKTGSVMDSDDVWKKKRKKKGQSVISRFRS